MLHKTKGIVLKSTKYAESSIVLQVLTAEFGLQSYLINGVRKNKSKYSPAIMQSLHLLDMIVYHKENGGIQRVSEIRNSPAYKSIPMDTVKSTLVMFMNEVICKSISHGHPDPRLFEFIFNYLLCLDLIEERLSNFLVFFLLDLSEELGFLPAAAENENEIYFDLKNGCFSSIKPQHPAFLVGAVCVTIQAILSAEKEDRMSVNFTKAARKELISFLLQYFAFHIDNFGQVKSWEVLQIVFE